MRNSPWHDFKSVTVTTAARGSLPENKELTRIDEHFHLAPLYHERVEDTHWIYSKQKAPHGEPCGAGKAGAVSH
jgi:hypothetical protein